VDAVLTGKNLNAEQRRALVYDIERGATAGGETMPWQTDTCIGDWHYQRSLFDQHTYKTARQVAQMLVDIVSKNGNLLLNIPLPGHGAPDADELKFLSEFTAWMDVNSEGIYATRPWKAYGEGPSTTGQAPRGRFGGTTDVRPYTSEDMRFTVKGDTLYAFIMAWPEARTAVVKSLATNSPHLDGRKVAEVSLLGYSGKLEWTQDEQGLNVKLPATPPSEHGRRAEDQRRRSLSAQSLEVPFDIRLLPVYSRPIYEIEIACGRRRRNWRCRHRNDPDSGRNASSPSGN